MLALTLAALVVYIVAFGAVLVIRGRAARAVRRADVPFPLEDLPTGGELARRLLEAQGLGAVQVVDADVDAYRAVSRELQLADGRIRRRSVAAWTVAAHEVGHAAQHRAGDPTWKRWWVLSGHALWVSLVLPAVLVVELLVESPVLIVIAGLLSAFLALVGGLSWSVERGATANARELLAGAALPDAALDEADQLLRRTAAAYIVESVIDTGFVDRAVEPFRGFAIGGPGGP